MRHRRNPSLQPRHKWLRSPRKFHRCRYVHTTITTKPRDFTNGHIQKPQSPHSATLPPHTAIPAPKLPFTSAYRSHSTTRQSAFLPSPPLPSPLFNSLKSSTTTYAVNQSNNNSQLITLWPTVNPPATPPSPSRTLAPAKRSTRR